MKISAPENDNYSAVVVEIKSITPLEGMDNVVGTPLLGFQAIVSKDTQVGDVGIVFPAETQLSEEYTRKNNLFRHGNLNENEQAKGYLEDNRRVKAMKFQGFRSDCLFMPLESLSYTKVKVSDLNVGDVFDKLNGKEICKKYLVKQPFANRQLEKNKHKFVRVDKMFLPEHYDSDNFFRNEHIIPRDKTVIVTQKLHGTSIRIGHTIVRRKLKLHEKVAKRLGVKVQETEFDHISGSRKVIKDPNNPNQQHYYETDGLDIWTKEGKKLEGILPQNFIIYGELIGWTEEGSPIQKNYTYLVPEKTCELYVYRIAFINNQGRLTDLSWEHVKEFCKDFALKHVPELWIGKIEDFKVEDFIDKRFLSEGYTQAVPLEHNPELVDEGVCVRVDSIAPYILKAKGPKFFEHETKMLDQEALDLEAAGSEA